MIIVLTPPRSTFALRNLQDAGVTSAALALCSRRTANAIQQGRVNLASVSAVSGQCIGGVPAAHWRRVDSVLVADCCLDAGVLIFRCLPL